MNAEDGERDPAITPLGDEVEQQRHPTVDVPHLSPEMVYGIVGYAQIR